MININNLLSSTNYPDKQGSRQESNYCCYNKSVLPLIIQISKDQDIYVKKFVNFSHISTSTNYPDKQGSRQFKLFHFNDFFWFLPLIIQISKDQDKIIRTLVFIVFTSTNYPDKQGSRRTFSLLYFI